MAISFGQIYLHSFAPEKLFDFLSFLLDVEAKDFETKSDTIRFDFQGIEFVILPSEKKRLSRTKYFSLSVENEKELEDLKNNIEFYHYKQMDSKFTLKTENGALEFSDPDSRVWQVKVRSAKNLVNSTCNSDNFISSQM